MASFTNIDIRKMRDLQKMTAASLAERISRDPTTIYNWEWAKVKDGTYRMFSIEGEAVRQEIEDDEEGGSDE